MGERERERKKQIPWAQTLLSAYETAALVFCVRGIRKKEGRRRGKAAVGCVEETARRTVKTRRLLAGRVEIAKIQRDR